MTPLFENITEFSELNEYNRLSFFDSIVENKREITTKPTQTILGRTLRIVMDLITLIPLLVLLSQQNTVNNVFFAFVLTIAIIFIFDKLVCLFINKFLGIKYLFKDNKKILITNINNKLVKFTYRNNSEKNKMLIKKFYELGMLKVPPTELCYKFYDEKFTCDSLIYEYIDIKSVYETSDYFFIMNKKRVSIAIRKDGFLNNNSIKNFSSFLTTKIKSKKFIVCDYESLQYNP